MADSVPALMAAPATWLQPNIPSFLNWNGSPDGGGESGVSALGVVSPPGASACAKAKSGTVHNVTTTATRMFLMYVARIMTVCSARTARVGRTRGTPFAQRCCTCAEERPRRTGHRHEPAFPRGSLRIRRAHSISRGDEGAHRRGP